MKIESYKKDSQSLEYYTISGKNRNIELTEWHNGEGFDIAFDDVPVRSLHYEDIDALMTLFFASRVSEPKL
jgi:hypothetical protein